MDNLVLAFALIGVLGIGAQWLAWRFNLPAIVLMAIAGVVAGPVLGIFGPPGADGQPPMEALFGEFYQPLIAIAVAVILFEGGLQLNFSELRGLTRGVGRLVFPGVAIAWALGAGAAYYIVGLSWQVALLFGGIMVVTGPTVIIPLLRQSKLDARPATLLKWEGIVNDPIGALLAVLVYEFIIFGNGGHASPGEIIGSIVMASALAGGLGFAIGRLAASSFRRGWVPEYLKPPVLLALVLVCFETANLLQHEAGLLAVTAMGVTMANARIASINELRLFKENIVVILVSGVFIILTANLTFESFRDLDWSAFWYLVAMLFIVRPLTVFVSTIGAGLPWQERLLVGWIAPRGVVAVAVSSFFGAALVTAGFADGAKLIPLAFAMVFATVIAHGFTIGPLAKALGLASRERPGVLIAGASPWSVALAAKLKELEIPVMVADASWRRLQPARLADVPTYYGEILSEVTEHHLDLNRFGYLLALSGNEAHNALVSTDLAPELGRAAIYQVNARGKDEEDRQALSYTLQGRTFLHSGAPLDELLRRHYQGWVYQRTRLSEEYPPEQYKEDAGPDHEIVLVVRKDTILFASHEAPVEPAIGDTVLAYIPKPPELTPEQKAEQKSGQKPDASETVETLPSGEPSPS
ncbi:MAG: sodium:proton antiporter [Alphaproteobacteria bacterium]|nr:sodium:proton antiporter [Alphaproteobacteria bacterium]